MPSTYSPSLRVELQYTGENVNSWGDKLNDAMTRFDSAIAGYQAVAVAANVTLTTNNGTADQARTAMLKFTGAGGFTVTVPSVSKQYILWNACTGTVTVSTGAGATVVMNSGDKIVVWSDGSAVYQLGFAGYGLKDYIDQAAIGATGSLPAAAGNSGKFIYSNGTSWAPRTPVTTDLSDFTSYMSTATTTATGLAVAFAIAL
jgi:hypothetical protein